jgi:hypothetical protein
MWMMFCQVTAESIEKQEDDTLLKCLIDISESAPKFLRPQLDQILNLCMKVSWSIVVSRYAWAVMIFFILKVCGSGSQCLLPLGLGLQSLQDMSDGTFLKCISFVLKHYFS